METAVIAVLVSMSISFLILWRVEVGKRKKLEINLDVARKALETQEKREKEDMSSIRLSAHTD